VGRERVEGGGGEEGRMQKGDKGGKRGGGGRWKGRGGGVEDLGRR